MSSQSRQPKGSPASSGGQFTSNTAPTSGIDLGSVTITDQDLIDDVAATQSCAFELRRLRDKTRDAALRVAARLTRRYCPTATYLQTIFNGNGEAQFYPTGPDGQRIDWTPPEVGGDHDAYLHGALELVGTVSIRHLPYYFAGTVDDPNADVQYYDSGQLWGLRLNIDKALV